MKKKLIGIILSAILMSALFVPEKAEAVDVGLGISSFYAKWDPVWKNSYDNFDIKNSIMVGPVLSVRFYEKWTLSAMGLYSVQNFDTTASFQTDEAPDGSGGWHAATVNTDLPIERLDIDVSLSYAIIPQLKIIAGGKIFAVGTRDTIGVDTYGHSGYLNEFMFEGAGPAAGIGLTLPLFSNFYISSNLTYVMLITTFETPINYENSPTSLSSETPMVNYVTHGFNATLNFSYYIAPINTAIVIGGRFQLMHYILDDDVDKFDVDGKNDYYYGVTLSVIYYF